MAMPAVPVLPALHHLVSSDLEHVCLQFDSINIPLHHASIIVLVIVGDKNSHGLIQACTFTVI